MSAQDALTLMISNGGQVILHGKACAAHWGKNRPLSKELLHAIRNGATRNLYLSHVPETTVAALTQLFGDYGEVLPHPCTLFFLRGGSSPAFAIPFSHPPLTLLYTLISMLYTSPSRP